MDLAEALVQTSFAGDAESVRILLQQSTAAGVDLNFATEEGFTLLMHAINGASNPPQPGGQHLEVCQLLVFSGVYIESVDAVYGRTAAHWAAVYNQAEILSLLITAGSNLATPDLQGLTAFHLAALSDSLACLEAMLQLVSAEILEFPSAEGLTPLMLAAQNGNVEACKLLLKLGANPHTVEALEQKSALHFATQASDNVMVELLIKSGSTLDLPDANGVTPLHIAASLNNTLVLSTICSIVGGDVLDIPDLSGLTPLMYACISGSEPCVKFILKKKTDLEATDNNEGKTCLHWAAQSTSPSMAAIVEMLCKKKKQLQNARDKYGHTPLHSATLVGSLEAVKTLLTMGSDPSVVDDDQYTAMHLATVNGLVEVLSIMLQYGCSPLPWSKGGCTPLHLAVQISALSQSTEGAEKETLGQNIMQCVKLLLAAKAPIDSPDDVGMQPIHWALQCNDNLDMIKFLISKGADITAKDGAGMTGLHVAAKYGVTDNCRYMIEEAGVHGNILDSHNQTALFYSIESRELECSEYLLSIGCSANHRNTDERSPAHIASSVGSVEGLELLVRYGGELGLVSARNTTPIHDAAANGHTDVLQYLLMAECDPNPCASRGNVASPLHFAAAGGHIDCAQLLIDAGANINAVLVSEEGTVVSPLDYAEDSNELKELLISNGALPGSEIKLPSDLPLPETEEAKGEVEYVMIEEKVDKKVESSPDLTARSMELVEVEPREEEAEKEEVVQPLKTPVRNVPPAELFAGPSDEAKLAGISVTGKFPQHRTGLVSKALDVLKKKKAPSSDTILSSVVGFYGAQATMLAGSVIGTSLGNKAMEIAEKVVTDAAQGLKKEEEDYDGGSLPDLEWLQTPEKEPTPPPPEPPTPPATPIPSPVPIPEIKMDPYDRRMRKAKAQMDQTKSLSYQAVEELIKAQTTHCKLKRQFVLASTKEELSKRKKEFEKQEQLAAEESKRRLEKYLKRMEKAELASAHVNKVIKEQLDSIHQQNNVLAAEMGRMGLSSRPTVAEWLEKKNKQKKEQLRNSLINWKRTKQQREEAISLQQALVSERALRHAAWGMKKSLTAQMQLLDRNPALLPTRKGISPMRKPTPWTTSKPIMLKPVQPYSLRPVQTQEQEYTDATSQKMLSTAGCMRATPVGFLKMHDSVPSNQHSPCARQRSSSVPDSMLWNMVAPSTTISSRTQHRAYGPKTLHAPRTLYFLPPDMYKQIKCEMRSSLAPDGDAESSSRLANKEQKREKGHDNTFSSKKLFPKTAKPLRQYHTLANAVSSSSRSGSLLAKKRVETVVVDRPSVALPMKIISPSNKHQTIVTA